MATAAPPSPATALLIIDVQNDFAPGGALAATHRYEGLVPTVNALLESGIAGTRVASKDWHPPTHVSFAANHPGAAVHDVITVTGPGADGKTMEYEQHLWPEHCVQGSRGADFVPGLRADLLDKTVLKGADSAAESYSAFRDVLGRDSGLAAWLRERGVARVVVVGIAAEYCVASSAHHALEEGFEVVVVPDAIAGVETTPGDTDAAFAQLREAGAKVVPSAELLQAAGSA